MLPKLTQIVNFYTSADRFYQKEANKKVLEYLNCLSTQPEQDLYRRQILSVQPGFPHIDDPRREFLKQFMSEVTAKSESFQYKRSPQFEEDKNLYLQNTKYIEFSEPFQQKLFTSFNMLYSVPIKGWNYGEKSLRDQIGAFRKLNSSFKEFYDPDNDLANPGPDCKYSVAVHQPKQKSRTIASYSKWSNKFIINVYIAPDGLDDHDPSDRKYQKHIQQLKVRTEKALSEEASFENAVGEGKFLIPGRKNAKKGTIYSFISKLEKFL